MLKMPPLITSPHFSNYLLIKRLLNPHNSLAKSDDEPKGGDRELLNTTIPTTTAAVTTEATTTMGTFMKMEKTGEEIIEKVAEKTHVPFWGVFFILLLILGIIVLVFYCCLSRWWRKFRGKEGKGFMGGKVDLKSVQLLGQAYKEKVSKHFYLTYFIQIFSYM